MASKSLGTLTVDLEARTGKFTAGMSQAERTTKKLQDQTKRQEQELERLVAKIDPVIGKLGELDKLEQQLAKHRKSGKLDAETYDDLNKKIQAQRNAISGTTTAYNKNAKSAKELAFATRGLPAQFTDIAVSLQAGQNPLTVFLQQGGQLKDMFGGVGQAARAMGGYVIGLINPFTVAAAAIGAFAVAGYKGADESDAFAESLAMTGNQAGVTVDQLMMLSAQMDSLAGVTQGKAAQALNAVAESGKFTADQFQLVATTAIQMEQATGQAIDDTVKQFEEIAGDPVDAIEKLNDKYHFLTAAQYENISSLVEVGRETDAVKQAMQLYSDTMDSRSKDIQKNLGWIEKSWNAVKNAAKEGWDAMLNVGRESTLQDQINDVDAEIARLRESQSKGIFTNVGGEARNKAAIDALMQQRAALMAQQGLEESIASEKAKQQRIEDQGIESIKYRDKLLSDNLSKQEQLTKAQAELNKQIQAAADAGTPWSSDEIAKANAALKEQYKDTQAVNSAKKEQREIKRQQREAEREMQKSLQERIKLEESWLKTVDGLVPYLKYQKQYQENVEAINNAYREGLITKQQYDEAMQGNDDEFTAGMGTGYEGFGKQIGINKDKEDDPFGIKSFYNESQQTFSSFENMAVAAGQNFLSTFQTAFASAIAQADSFSDALSNIGKVILGSVVSAIAQMAAQWLAMKAISFFVGESSSKQSQQQAAETGGAIASAMAPAAALTSLATGGTNSFGAMAGIAATQALTMGLAGMAHDGIDSVPKEGTWLLQKGERVTTAETSQKLDRTLNDIGSNQNSSGGNVTIINNSSAQMRERKDSSGNWIVEFVNDLATNGPASKAITQNMNTNRRAR